MTPIVDLAREHGIPVIEDAAGAIGARYRGRMVGGLGDAAIFSFNGNKTVTAGGGGVIVTDRADWADRAHSLSTQAREGAAYRHTEVGFNYRMPNLNAALGLAQLDRLDEMAAAKREIAARYDAALARPRTSTPHAESAMGGQRLLALFGRVPRRGPRPGPGAPSGSRRESNPAWPG